MKATILFAAALLSSTVMASAADLGHPVIASQPVPYSWTGWHFGALVSYTDSTSTVSNIEFEGTPAGIDPYSVHPRGFGLGAEVGYDQQFGSMVVGFAVDGDWLNATNKDSRYLVTPYNFSTESKVDWMSTARLRAGFAVDRALFYATGGLAVGSVESVIHDVYPGPVTVTTSDTNTQVGWTLGGGIDFAVTDKISLKAEYLYYDLGSHSNTFYEGAGGWNPITTSLKTTGSIGRIGANFRF